MNSLFKLKNLNPISYFQKGDNPKLLLMSGTHGDEYGVIKPLKKVIEKYSNELPDLIFIPEVSPSAVKLETRKNKLGHDTNRKFSDSTSDPEAAAVMKIVSGFNFELGLSFHEDWEYDSFYIYDSEQMDSQMLNDFKNKIKKLGLKLYSGIDDIHDAELGAAVLDGYLVDIGSTDKLSIGDFWHWSLVNGYVKRLLYPEIPSALLPSQKFLLTDLIFQDIIFPLIKTRS